jgi:hypothetical protein
VRPQNRDDVVSTRIEHHAVTIVAHPTAPRRRSSSCVKASGRILMATSRPSCVDRAPDLAHAAFAYLCDHAVVGDRLRSHGLRFLASYHLGCRPRAWLSATAAALRMPVAIDAI